MGKSKRIKSQTILFFINDFAFLETDGDYGGID